MIDPEMRRAVFRLHQAGMGIRQIRRNLGLSRHAIRHIIKEEGAMPQSIRADKIDIDADVLRKLYRECDGYSTRVFEKLTEEGIGEEAKKYAISYPTLTRRLRELGLGSSREERCDRRPDEPGAEMQHDTTVYTVRLGDCSTKLVASIVYLRYSKRRYLKLYRSFRRFHMKCFLHEALEFWGYSCPRCIIDNTNLARLRGTGKNAVIVPEMEAFAKRYGFEFRCHEIGHPNRKAGNERSFYTTETNFLPGRRFESLEDLNAQALQWATVKREQMPVGKSRLIPAVAFEYEKTFLTKLPPHLPAPYLALARTVDQYGYVAVAANYYWVPGEGRGEVKVLLFGDHLEIYRRRERLAEYRLPAAGTKNECFSPKGHPKPRYKPKNRRWLAVEEEKRLRALGEVVGNYLDFALREKGPQRRYRFLRELFALSRQLTPAGFVRAVERAMKYRIDGVETIRRIAVRQLLDDGGTIPVAEVDESFQRRESYLEGRLSDTPDFSDYDDLLEEDHG